MNENQTINIEEYLNKLEDEKKQKLLLIRNLVKNKFPQSTELISYGMPAFKYSGKILIYYAAFKNHISIFPAPRSIKEFENELKKYKGGKGTIQFADNEPLPVSLIERIIIFRASQILDKIELKKSKKP